MLRDFLLNLINYEYFTSLQFSGTPFQIVRQVFSEFWWLIVPILTYSFVWFAWDNYTTGKFLNGINHKILAIDVPINNERSPQHMENFFNALHGAHGSIAFIDKYWNGALQEWFSLEIVGIDGHVRFMIRTPDYHQDLIESQLYAHYPDVSIYEVEDYTKFVPDKMPHPEWDMGGFELVLANKKDFIPFRTYPLFEHGLSQSFIDPVASLVETMTKLRPGEQIWVQWLMQPALGDKWVENGLAYAQKLAGKEVKAKQSKLAESAAGAGAMIGDYTKSLVEAFGFPESEAGADSKGKDADFGKAFLRTPGEVDILKAIEQNVSKTYYNIKCRMIYIGRKEVFHKPRIASGMGFFKQLTSFSLNGIRPYPRTMATSIKTLMPTRRLNKRKNNLLKGYKRRSLILGAPTYHLNTEALATVFHFPDITVQAPLIRTMEAKEAAPPANLPLAEME